MEGHHSLPIVDMEEKEEDVLAKQIVDALRTTGFLYLINHGIDANKVSRCFEQSKQFFTQNIETKSKLSRASGKHVQSEQMGYVATGRETLDKYGRHELRESFNFVPSDKQNFHRFSQNHANFLQALQQLFDESKILSQRVISLIAQGLRNSQYLHHLNNNQSDSLEQSFAKILTDSHNDIGEATNATSLRTLYYPQINDNNDPQNHSSSSSSQSSPIQAKMTRIGAHTDYGSVTLLFQDDVGGLQVEAVQGQQYVNAHPIKGSVLVNIGDLLQFWTSNQLRATMHRVEANHSPRVRQSIAFFVHPSRSTLIKPLDQYSSSNHNHHNLPTQSHPNSKTTFITAGEHIMRRLDETYK